MSAKWPPGPPSEAVQPAPEQDQQPDQEGQQGGGEPQEAREETWCHFGWTNWESYSSFRRGKL